MYRAARLRVLYGGRASSKTHEFGGVAAFIGSQYPLRFLCVRRYQNKIKDSVYTVIKNKIDDNGETGYTVQANAILNQNGTEFAFYGIERNTDEIKSFEGADILWIEEAHNLTQDQWDILEPTIRKAGSEIWISFNPDLMTDFIWQEFIVKHWDNAIIRKVNYDENPHLSKTMLESIERVKKDDPEKHEHIYLGVPKSDDQDAIIKRTFLESCVDAHKKLGIALDGAFTVGYDVADAGQDTNATASFNGAICEAIDEWKGREDELQQSALRAMNKAKQRSGHLIYDGGAATSTGLPC